MKPLLIIACSLIILGGAFVAGSEIWDIFDDEANFTTDHFILGMSQLAMGAGISSKLKP